MKTYLTHTALAVLLAAAFLGGCGKSKSDEAKKAAEAAVPAAPVAPKEGRAVEIKGDDTMKFSVTEITVKKGEAIALTLRNIGTMPKFSMGHNWVLLTNKASVPEFANAAALSVKTEYVPAARAAEIIASTKLLGPGESDTVLFYAPKAAGRYPFLCTFPGHFQVGMKGTLIVE